MTTCYDEAFILKITADDVQYMSSTIVNTYT